MAGAEIKAVLAEEEEKKDEIDGNMFVKGEEKKVDGVIPLLTRAKVNELADPEKLLLIIVKDKVYDCTKWQYDHPGGHLTIRALCGKDATDPFTSMHPNRNPFLMLPRYLYAKLDIANEKADPIETEFRELTAKLEKEGWFETRYSYYYLKAAIFVSLFSSVVYGVLAFDSFWVHCLAGCGLGIFWQQIAFCGHDLGHNSVTHDLTSDSFLGLLCGNFLTGISIGWWKRSHNVHHIVTNSCEHDPDIQHLPVFAVNTLFLSKKVWTTFYDRYMHLDAIAFKLVKYQHILYYPIMAFARFNLYAQSLTHALGCGDYKPDEKLWNRSYQVATLVGFWVWLLALTLQLPTWASRIAFFLLAHNVAGILHVQITLSHFCMPSYSGTTYDNASNGWVKTQTETSLDVDCPLWMDWFHGGLQYQTLHHLWPTMPRHNYRKVRPIFEQFCQKHDIKYHHADFVNANIIMLKQLKKVADSSDKWSELFADSINMAG